MFLGAVMDQTILTPLNTGLKLNRIEEPFFCASSHCIKEKIKISIDSELYESVSPVYILIALQR